MKKISFIALKELNAYFKSPTAYIILIITISVFNIFFFMIIDESREASLRDMFKLMEFMFVFIVPLLTMRTFSEEKRSGTIEFLLTCPIKESAVVLGKYFGSLIFLFIIISITSVYYLIIEYFSNPDRIAIAAGYLGIFIEGALFISIGLFTSSLTKNQILAAVSSYVILFMLYFSISFIKYFSGPAEQFIRHISFWSHTENLAAGLINSSDLIYYLSGIIFCLIFTNLTIKNR